MSAEPATTPKNRVTLLRLGVGKEEIALHKGATLADLFRLLGVKTDNQEIFIDGRPLLECLTLHPDAIVSVVPKVRNAAGVGDWRGAIGISRDDPLFEESVKAGRAYREAQGEALDFESEPTSP